MKNASIQVNAEKRIVNVGLRLFSIYVSVGSMKDIGLFIIK